MPDDPRLPLGVPPAPAPSVAQVRPGPLRLSLPVAYAGQVRLQRGRAWLPAHLGFEVAAEIPVLRPSDLRLALLARGPVPMQNLPFGAAQPQPAGVSPRSGRYLSRASGEGGMLAPARARSAGWWQVFPRPQETVLRVEKLAEQLPSNAARHAMIRSVRLSDGGAPWKTRLRQATVFDHPSLFPEAAEDWTDTFLPEGHDRLAETAEAYPGARDEAAAHAITAAAACAAVDLSDASGAEALALWRTAFGAPDENRPPNGEEPDPAPRSGWLLLFPHFGPVWRAEQGPASIETRPPAAGRGGDGHAPGWVDAWRWDELPDAAAHRHQTHQRDALRVCDGHAVEVFDPSVAARGFDVAGRRLAARLRQLVSHGMPSQAVLRAAAEDIAAWVALRDAARAVPVSCPATPPLVEAAVRALFARPGVVSGFARHVVEPVRAEMGLPTHAAAVAAAAAAMGVPPPPAVIPGAHAPVPAAVLDAVGSPPGADADDPAARYAAR